MARSGPHEGVGDGGQPVHRAAPAAGAGRPGPRRHGRQQPRGGHPAGGAPDPLRPPGARARSTAALGPHRDDFDIVYDNTAYGVADLEPMVELFAGRVQHFVFTSSSAVYRRSFVQPMLESFRTHDASDDDPAQVLRRRQGALRAVPARPSTRRGGFPATVLRVAHTLGPMSPLAVARPDLLRPPRGGPPDPDPRRGVLVRPPDPRRRRRRADGVDRRQRPGAGRDLQRRRAARSRASAARSR